MKIDTYKHKERYLKWKEKVKLGIPDLSKENSEIIIKYLSDIERGINISSSSPKGSRSYIRLNSLKEKRSYFSYKMVFCREYRDLIKK